MKIEFSKIDIVDDAANRLMKYINKSDGKFNRKKISSKTAKDFISGCFGHDDYSSLQSTLSSQPPQIEFLNEKEFGTLKQQYLQRLEVLLGISNKLAEELWMASYPYVELYTSNKKLLLGQIGRRTIDWDDPDDENISYNVFQYVQAIKCPMCNSKGRILPHNFQENYYDECQECGGSGVFHKPDQKLNQIRLTEKELELQHRYNSYYDELEDEMKYSSGYYLQSKYQNPHYSERAFAEEWDDNNF